MPSVFLEPSKWTQLHTMTLEEELNSSAIRKITNLLTKFPPRALQDVTAQFRVRDKKDIIYAANCNDTDYVEACLELETALSQLPRHQVSFRGSSRLRARKHLWLRELGRHFPALRKSDRLNVICESSEKL